MAVATIYPIRNYWYVYTNPKWQDARGSLKADSVSTGPNSPIGIISGFSFYRTYLSFELSSGSIPADSVIENITISLKRTDAIRGVYSPIIAYGGLSILSGIIGEFPLYIDNLVASDPLDTISIDNNLKYFTSRSFDLTTYSSITPGSTLTVGIIDSLDFDYSTDQISNTYLIDTNTEGSYPPFLTVTYRQGYPNSIMGIDSANVSGVMGISAANISNIMGV
jgi:hypothetical protein